MNRDIKPENIMLEAEDNIEDSNKFRIKVNFIYLYIKNSQK